MIDANFEDAVEYDEGASFEGAIFEEISSEPSPEMEALLSQVECAFWTTVINAHISKASVPKIDSCTQKEVQEVMRKDSELPSAKTLDLRPRLPYSPLGAFFVLWASLDI